jgi:hypothetical protein
MSLRKSPTLTPALLAANRGNAQKSTGPRTARGKARSRRNGLRKGTRSPFYRDLLQALFYAPPCRVKETARLFLSREEESHPLIARTVELFAWAEGEVVLQSQMIGAMMAEKAIKKTTCEAGKLLKTKHVKSGNSPHPENLLKTIQLQSFKCI